MSERKAEQSKAQVGSGYLRPGLVPLSGVLVLGVLTLGNRNPGLSRKQKRINPDNSDAGYGVLLHHEFGKGNRKDATRKVYRRYRAIVIARVQGKAEARMCTVGRGYKTHEEELGKGNFGTCDRFSADGFRTRAVRVIRWRVLGVRVAKGKNRKKESVTSRCFPDAWENGVCM